MKKFTCTVIWRGNLECGNEAAEVVVEAEKANDARKSLSKRLRDQGWMEGKDFIITTVEGEDANDPPPPFVKGEDW